MISFLAKRRILYTGCVENIKTHLGSRHISRTFAIASSTTKKDTKNRKHHSFTVSYLINTCGLSPEVAISISQKLKFESFDRPNTVLALLRNQGFENVHISKLIIRRPSLLLITKPEITLLPKLNFLVSIGASSDDLASNPNLLACSLDNKLIPCYDFLKSMHLSDQQIVYVLRRISWDFFPLIQRNLCANVAFLKQIGVPQYYITQLICTKSRVMKQDSDKFKNYVQEVLELEFQPSKSSFYQALYIIGGMRKLTWERKKKIYKSWGWSDHEFLKKIYKSWGWSDHEFLLAVKKHPLCMSLSEKKIMSGMDFLVNKMGFQSMAIARTPIVLCFCLEKRIVPRCKVARVLQLKGLIKEDLSLYYVLQHSEKHFLDKFVVQYHQQVPQLLAVYQGKVGLVEVGIAPGNMLGIAKS